jgi:hypothetical protein
MPEILRIPPSVSANRPLLHQHISVLTSAGFAIAGLVRPAFVAPGQQTEARTSTTWGPIAMG